MNRQGFIVSLIVFLFFSSNAMSQPYEKLFKSVVFVSSSRMNSQDLTEPVVHKGMGVGIVMDKKGHVIVQDSIISDKYSIECANGFVGYWPAVFLGRDKVTNIAVLQIKAPEHVLAKLEPAVVPKKRFRSFHGQDVVLIGVGPDGNPLVYKAVINNPSRSIRFGDNVIENVGQISTFVHRGLIGAPIYVNRNLIGIAIDPGLEMPPNVGFFINAKEIYWAAQAIIKEGKVTRAYLGAKVISVSPDLKRLLNLPCDKGLLVIKVEKGSPAEKAGLLGCSTSLRLGNRVYPRGGDIIVAIDGRPVGTYSALIRLLNKKGPGKKIVISYYRNRRLLRTKAVLEAR